MGDAKPSVLIPLPSRDRDLLVPPAAVAPHASPSVRAGAGADSDDETKLSSASAASAAAQTGREVAASHPFRFIPLCLHRARFDLLDEP
jgi:hypothetical protein